VSVTTKSKSIDAFAEEGTPLAEEDSIDDNDEVEEEGGEEEESHLYRRHPISHHASARQIDIEYPSFQSPPTIYTPHTSMSDRMAMSTTQKKQYEGRVVHVPKKSKESGELGGSNDDDDIDEEEDGGMGSGTARKSSMIDDDGVVGGRQQQQQQHSAPARIPVSFSLHLCICFLICPFFFFAQAKPK
jgi:hypothetical protein